MRNPVWIIIVILLVVVLLGGVGGPRINPNWQYGYGYGNTGVGLLGVVLVVFLILWVMGYM